MWVVLLLVWVVLMVGGSWFLVGGIERWSFLVSSGWYCLVEVSCF